MTDDIEERAALARRGVMDHSDCEECTEDWTFLMRQGRREFRWDCARCLRASRSPNARARCPSCRRIGGLESTGGIDDDDARRGGRLWMCSSMAGKGGKHRDQPGVIHEVHRRRGPWRRDGDKGRPTTRCARCATIPSRSSACSVGRRKAVRVGPTGDTTGATCRACAATTRTLSALPVCGSEPSDGHPSETSSEGPDRAGPVWSHARRVRPGGAGVGTVLRHPSGAGGRP